jgi:hypothetical protein
VRRADSIDIVFLHKEEIMTEEFERDRSSEVRMVLMPIYTSKFHRFPIDDKHAILKTGASKANSLFNNTTSDRQYEMVQVWSLRGPLVRLLNVNAKYSRASGVLLEKISGSVEKLKIYVTIGASVDVNG